MITTTTVLASHTWDGPYESLGETRLVQRKDKVWLLHDAWLGGSIEGQCLRAVVYRVPAERVEEVRRAVESGEVSYLPEELECLGRQDRLPWARDL